MPEPLKGRDRLDQAEYDGEKERAERDEVVAPAPPHEEGENAGEQRQHRHLIDGHGPGRAPTRSLKHYEPGKADHCDSVGGKVFGATRATAGIARLVCNATPSRAGVDPDGTAELR